MHEASPDAEDQTDVLFDAVLMPHRSLSPRGFLALMLAVCVISFGAGLAFFLAGAWPVVGFLGLDVLLVFGAFKLSYRSARGYESLCLTRDGLTVRRVDPQGRERFWQFQPTWLQVEMDDPPRHERRLELRSHGRSLAIGGFLTPSERLDLAQALRAALAEARTAPGLA